MGNICRKDDRRCYQPRIHLSRIKQLYHLGQETNTKMTVLVDRALDTFVGRCVGEYNVGMRNFENIVEELAKGVSCFNLQYVDDRWLLSYVDDNGDAKTIENTSLKELITFASSEDQHEVLVSSAPPSPRNP